MDAKDKAFELVMEFKRFVNPFEVVYEGVGKTSTINNDTIKLFKAKQCAVIVCHEVIMSQNDPYDTPTDIYWNKVIQEIEKL